eukprot:1392715-Amorphochlora_amoeboformis.AAC.2
MCETAAAFDLRGGEFGNQGEEEEERSGGEGLRAGEEEGKGVQVLEFHLFCIWREGMRFE